MVDVKIVVEEGRTLKEEVDKEISKFEEWFRSFLQNADPLTRHEKAILNDYLGWKTIKG